MKRINEAAFSSPWAMKEDVVLAMKEIVERHLRGEKLSDLEVAARTSDKKEPPAYEVVDGTARIPIYGIISKRSSLITRISQNGTSTLEIGEMMNSAISDPAVKRILLDVDSPGGSCDGVIELSDLIYSLRGKKEIISYANGQMCSAAYWIGSAADKIYASRGAIVGSIGVYSVISDWTVANHNAGLKTEVLKAGKNKAAGHPDKPFTPEDRDVIQKEVNKFYDLFVEAVARNRGMSIDNMLNLATGDIFIGQDALDNGLVDGIKTFDAIFNSAEAGSARKVQSAAAGTDLNIEYKETVSLNQEANMFEVKTATPDQLKAENKALAETLIAEGRAAGLAEGKAAGIIEGKAAGIEEGKSSEKKRVEGITASMPEGMETNALSAIKEGKTVEEAKDAYLKAFKKEAPTPPGPNGEESAVVKSHLTRAQEYQKEHKCGIAEALSATADNRQPAKQ